MAHYISKVTLPSGIKFEFSFDTRFDYDRSLMYIQQQVLGILRADVIALKDSPSNFIDLIEIPKVVNKSK